MNEKKYALNASAVNFAINEVGMGARMDDVLGGNGGRPKILYVRRPRAIEFLPDGGVQFNVNAPDARTVEVGGRPGTLWGAEKHPLVKGEDGVWTTTLYDIPAGFQYMNFYFDGEEKLYNLAPIGWGYGFAVNFVDVPDREHDFYDVKDVPHGAVRQEFYKSSFTGSLRNCWVYTPPSYDTAIEKRYPVWYIQHGGGENEIGWFWQGKINFILDNLIAEGKCEEMIVVSNAGYAYEPRENEYEFLPGDLGELLRRDCIPFIDRRFRTIPSRHSRAMAGLSMGGMQSNVGVFRNPETFANVGIFSGGFTLTGDGFDLTDVFEDPDKFHERFDLVFVAAGEQEQPMCDRLREQIEAQNALGVDTVFYSCPGYHEWDTWRNAARNFMEKLFR